MPLKQINANEATYTSAKRPSKRDASLAKYNRKWELDPESFAPFKSSLKRDYFKQVINALSDVKGKTCLDLGSGYGTLSKRLADLGAKVTAVDISEIALSRLEDHLEIKKIQDFVPYTTLEDNAYDYVIAANLIAELPEDEHRLFFSEVARLIKPQGKVVISTPLDVNTEDALARFLYLAETELIIESFHFCYHRLYIKGMLALNKLKKIANPIIQWLQNRDLFLFALEKVTKFLYDEEGISYVVIVATRRPLLDPLPEIKQPMERKGKKTIWE